MTGSVQIDDQRPRVGFKSDSISATADHTQLQRSQSWKCWT